ncbi:MAG TPA: hypothetical protein VGQ62_01160 [Chloroflexota bacterium]|jgi:DNA-binding response OmpR family regulator|nr:hypothetical protein [Chloroflexota bacterium]
MTTHTPICVLVAEHDLWRRRTVTWMLSEAGFAVREATNGMAAVRTASRELPQIVLLGADLPEISSAEVARTVQSDPRMRHTAVVQLEAPGNSIELLASVVNALDAHQVELQRSAAGEISATAYVLARASSRVPVAAIRA